MQIILFISKLLLLLPNTACSNNNLKCRIPKIIYEPRCYAVCFHHKYPRHGFECKVLEIVTIIFKFCFLSFFSARAKTIPNFPQLTVIAAYVQKLWAFHFKKKHHPKAHLIQIASNIFTFTSKIAIIALPMYNLRIYTTLPILMSNPKFNLHGWK